MMHFPHCFRKKYLKRGMTRRALTSKTAWMKWQRLARRVTENDNFRNVKNSQKEERNFQKGGSRPSKRMEMGIKMYIALMRRQNHQLQTSITSIIVFLTVKPVSCRWRKQSLKGRLKEPFLG
ncbi:kinesin-like protein KIF21A isoform X2 [Tachyglossus aculeatus]|uniref:kinesin-like protein KIF21A isoform X2 n=1 Tax=Tachyglossus aculeatus TaxID=9261 RepID=UPI0018F3A82E|nr:kinesin-like protein KIF21A isoform X2 [Tachyglossus aculeatus]